MTMTVMAKMKRYLTAWTCDIQNLVHMLILVQLPVYNLLVVLVNTWCSIIVKAIKLW